MLNLFNFMDGIDGIAASESIYIGIAGSTLAWLSGQNGLALAFALLTCASCGFILWNWPPAKIFLGDVGSGFLGIMLATLVFAGSVDGKVPAWSWLILFGVFIIDATVTLIRRFLRREKWYAAHRSHTYQHLALKKGHLWVTLAMTAINIVWLSPLPAVQAKLKNKYNIRSIISDG